MTHTINRPDSSENGNVLVILLVLIVLFAGLYFVVGQSMRVNSSNIGVSSEKAALMVTEILAYAENVRLAVANVKLANGCSNSTVNFDTPIVPATYVNTTSPASGRCNIFDKRGGGLTWAKAPPEATSDSSAPSNYIITGHSRVPSVGTTTADLLLVLYKVDPTLCQAINETLAVTNIPTVLWFDLTPFTGGYSTSPADTGLSGQKYGCFQTTAGSVPGYTFFYVLAGQ